MSPKLSIRSVTMIELIISMTIFMVIILTLTNVDKFSRYNAINADRLLKLHNQASFILEHMTRNIARAIGNEPLNGDETVLRIGLVGGGPYVGLTAYTDTDNDGQTDPEVTEADRWIGYLFNYDQHRIEFCPDCFGWTDCMACGGAVGSFDILPGNNIYDLTIDKPLGLSDNFINVSVTTCFDPTEADDSCGTQINPSVTMNTSIAMPSVSTH
jgi:hypothetical protein